MQKTFLLAKQKYLGETTVAYGTRLQLDQNLKNAYASWRAQYPMLAVNVEKEKQRFQVEYWSEQVEILKAKLAEIGDNAGKQSIELHSDLDTAEGELRLWSDGSAFILDIGCFLVWESRDYSKADRKLAWCKTFLTPARGTKLTIEEAFRLASEEEVDEVVNFFDALLNPRIQELKKSDSEEKKLPEAAESQNPNTPQHGSE